MRVYVGMSGGVDSSVAAALLVEQGHDVTGVFMKNWTQDLPGMKCPWADDLADAKRVAVQLGIDFKVFDFEKEYKQNVVDYMIAEYQAGRTPNPDIMCNQEVKFKLFLETALADGADAIATGHYAQIHRGSDYSADDSGFAPGSAQLLQAKDDNKDQTYFLYRVTAEALARTLFPLGGFTKDEVRQMAKERNLYTATKKESMGICFVGKVGIRDFLGQYVKSTPGKIIDKQSGNVLGYHDGAIFYTIGQRHGLDIGGGLPFYVAGKDMDKNEVYVTTQLHHKELWSSEIELRDIHWIAGEAPAGSDFQVRIRHRAPLISAVLNDNKLQLKEEQRAVAAGQSVVVYDGEICLGGGIIS